MKRLLACLAFAATLLPTVATAGVDAPALYTQHCASCHGPGRLGAMGPALLPESLERLKRRDAVATIREGRAATQMPSFGQTLQPDEIEALAGWIYSPVSPAPSWSEADIRASRVETPGAAALPARGSLLALDLSPARLGFAGTDAARSLRFVQQRLAAKK